MKTTRSTPIFTNKKLKGARRSCDRRVFSCLDIVVGRGSCLLRGTTARAKVLPRWHRNDVGPEAFPRHGAKTMSGQRRFPDMAQKRRRARGVPPTWRKNDVGSEVFPRHGTETTSGATMIILADHQRSRKKIPAQPSGYSHKILKILFSFKNAFCFIEFCCHCFCNFC